MLRSVIGFEKILGKDFKDEAVGRFLHLIERTTGFEVVADMQRLPLEDASLRDLMALAEKLRKAGILTKIQPLTQQYWDEPRMYSWLAEYRKDEHGGGSSLSSNRQALTAAIAEGLERHVWWAETDYFRDPITSSEKDLRV